MAKAVTLDFTDVKDGSLHRRTRFPEGDYKGRVLSVVDQVSSKDDTPMWVYTIEVKQGKRVGTYPYYCKIDPKNLWKLRSLFAAAGIVIPKKRFQVDPNKIVGKFIGVTLVDDEYKDKINSGIDGVIPLADIADADDPEIDDQDDDEDEDEAPPVVKKTKRRPVPVEPDEDDDEEEDEPPAKPVKAKRRKVVEPEPDEDDEEDEEPTPPPVKKTKRKPAPVVEEPEDEDDEEEDEEPAPKKPVKKTGKKARQIAAVSDDELEELDIDDL